MSQLFGLPAIEDYGNVGHSVKLYEGYKDWLTSPAAQEIRESGATTDFPTYLSDKINKTFMTRYDRWASEYKKYVRPISVGDFKEVSWVSLSGFPELLQVREGGGYHDAQVSEIAGPKVQLKKFGRTFSLTFETIVNDDLGRFRDIPAAMAEASAMTISIDIVQRTLENPGTAYDGTAFFHNDHNNLSTTALAEASLASAITAMKLQTDTDGQRVRVMPRVLVVPPQLEFVARRIVSDAPIYQPGSGLTAYNPVAGSVEVVVEPYLTDANDWYLFTAPGEGRAPMVIAFYNGNENPTVYLRDESIRQVLGGVNHNPYNFNYDEIWWKIRHFWAVKMWEFRSAHKASVT